MLFLLNDVIFNLKAASLTPPMAAERFRSVSLGFVRRLGAEVFSEQPRLQALSPERARRLSVLIAAKAPTVNAALFTAPAFACQPDEVATRFAAIGFDFLAWLYDRQRHGELDPSAAHREVWARLVA